MSVSSKVMAEGAFPETSGMPTPLINAAVYFDVLPKLDVLKTAFKHDVLSYERFRTLPVEQSGSWVWKPTDVSKLESFRSFLLSIMLRRWTWTPISSARQ